MRAFHSRQRSLVSRAMTETKVFGEAFRSHRRDAWDLSRSGLSLMVCAARARLEACRSDASQLVVPGRDTSNSRERRGTTRERCNADGCDSAHVHVVDSITVRKLPWSRRADQKRSPEIVRQSVVVATIRPKSEAGNRASKCRCRDELAKKRSPEIVHQRTPLVEGCWGTHHRAKIPAPA